MNTHVTRDKENAIFLIARYALFSWASALVIICFRAQAQTQETPATPASPAATLRVFSSAPEGKPPPPWRTVGLPGNSKKPLTQFDIVQLGAERVLRVRADRSYANLTYDLTPKALGNMQLRWRWRLDQPVAGADLLTKGGDDMPIRVCALFDMPLDKLGFVERSLLRLARSSTGEPLPAATLCYVWDQKLAAGTMLPNAFTKRVRYLVLNSANSPLQQWVSQSRDLRADFLRAFGAESSTVPPLLAIAVGADADNTAGSSLAYVGDVAIVEQ